METDWAVSLFLGVVRHFGKQHMLSTKDVFPVHLELLLAVPVINHRN